MFSFLKTNKFDSKEAVDIIEDIVYQYLKPLGFKKYGPTLHRFVDGDISQIVNFQNGCLQKEIYNVLWVNLGIRVPECVERKFVISQPLKKYYHEYECNIRTRLGAFVDNTEAGHSLKGDPYRTGRTIVEKLEKHVLPVFDVLNSRQAILENRRNYRAFDEMNHHLILLEEAMIYGRKGDRETAGELFREYYQEQIKEHQYASEHGDQICLPKGASVMYRNAKTEQTETIVANKGGYATLYHFNTGHLEYLEALAEELDIVLGEKENS